MSFHPYSIHGVEKEPLTFKEELRLGRLWQKNRTKDGEPTSEAGRVARDRLISGYILFTVKSVRTRFPRTPEDVVLEVAHSALLSAINAFDPKRKKDRLGRLSNLLPFHILAAMRVHRHDAQTVRLPMRRYNESVSSSIDAPVLSNGGVHHGGPGNDRNEDGIVLTLFAHPSVDIERLLGLNEDSPAVLAQREEKLVALEKAVDSLTPGSRQMILFHYFDGLNFAEIGRRLEISREASRQRHARAMEELRTALAQQHIFQHDDSRS